MKEKLKMKEIFERKINLQLFAEAGSVVNSLTNGFVNAHTGETDPFTSANTLSPELKTYYDTELLENARIELYYAQFAKKQTLPKKHGGTVEWRKFNTFKKADRLIEGFIPEGQKGGTSVKTGFIAQYGTYVAVTDILEMRAYDDVILGYIANDRMYRVMKSFFEKEITDVALLHSLSALDLGRQYVAITEKACKQIKILSEKILSPLELGILKERSIVRREEGIALTENILKQYRREGKYFDEIIGG
jgi:hypothetical protein